MEWGRVAVEYNREFLNNIKCTDDGDSKSEISENEKLDSCTITILILTELVATRKHI